MVLVSMLSITDLLLILILGVNLYTGIHSKPYIIPFILNRPYIKIFLLSLVLILLKSWSYSWMSGECLLILLMIFGIQTLNRRTLRRDVLYKFLGEDNLRLLLRMYPTSRIRNAFLEVRNEFNDDINLLLNFGWPETIRITPESPGIPDLMNRSPTSITEREVSERIAASAEMREGIVGVFMEQVLRRL